MKRNASLVRAGYYVTLALLVLELSVPKVAQAQPAPSNLDRRVDGALQYNSRRILSTNAHSPWKIMHGVLGMGGDFQIRDGSTGDMIRAVDFLCAGARVSGRSLFYRTRHGIEPILDHDGEGHPDQFLAVFAQVGVPLTKEIKFDGSSHTVGNLLSQAQAEYCPGDESSWTLIALSTYLPLNSSWRNQRGQTITIADLVSSEVSQSVYSGPCGGTHNLHALAYALDRYRATEAPLTGVWQRADNKLAEHLRLARSYQNRDGSFSENYFDGRGQPRNTEEMLYATGHMLEWLLVYVSDEELNSPLITGGVNAIVTGLERLKSQPIDVGTLYHACHALRLYQQRRAKVN